MFNSSDSVCSEDEMDCSDDDDSDGGGGREKLMLSMKELKVSTQRNHTEEL